MLGGEFYFGGPLEDRKHPQFGIIKDHIERAVQDLFLESLRSKSEDLVYIFAEEKQIDHFIKRTISYWEKLENYETCKEIVDLSKSLKRKWKKRDKSPDSAGLERLKKIFEKQKDEGFL